jgi:hypothetical protein
MEDPDFYQFSSDGIVIAARPELNFVASVQSRSVEYTAPGYHKWQWAGFRIVPMPRTFCQWKENEMPAVGVNARRQVVLQFVEYRGNAH